MYVCTMNVWCLWRSEGEAWKHGPLESWTRVLGSCGDQLLLCKQSLLFFFFLLFLQTRVISNSMIHFPPLYKYKSMCHHTQKVFLRAEPSLCPLIPPLKKKLSNFHNGCSSSSSIILASHHLFQLLISYKIQHLFYKRTHLFFAIIDLSDEPQTTILNYATAFQFSQDNKRTIYL